VTHTTTGAVTNLGYDFQKVMANLGAKRVRYPLAPVGCLWADFNIRK